MDGDYFMGDIRISRGDIFYVSRVRSTGSVVMSGRPAIIVSNDALNHTSRIFEVVYTQAQSDSLNWMRWQIAYENETAEPFYDTGAIYGTAQLETTYDGFFSGNSYAVRCTAQTVNGIVADTGWVSFRVDYKTSVLHGFLNAKLLKGCAAEITWNDITYIRGEADGNIAVENGEASLPENAKITWDQVNGESMSFPPVWSVAYCGKTVSTNPAYPYAPAYDSNLFRVETEDGIWELFYRAEQQRFFAAYNGSELAGIGEIPYTARLSALLTPDTVYLRAEVDTYSDGLYPSETLYPSATLYPKSDGMNPVLHKTFAQFHFPQKTIQKIQIFGVQTCEYLYVLKGVPSAEIINAIYNAGDLRIDYDPDTMYFAANFDYGLGAGNLDNTTNENIIGVSLYRRQGKNSTLQHVTNLPLSVKRVLDYSLASQQGEYQWYLFAIGKTVNISDGLSSNTVSPCDWDWTILVCDETENGYYSLKEEFRFGKNLTSGTITNGNVPGIFQNFTRFPSVQRSPVNYMAGTLTSLIGVIDYENNFRYKDTIALRDKIFALGTRNQHLFLKNRKGDFFPICISGAITMTTMDNTREQAQTAAIPWVQIGLLFLSGLLCGVDASLVKLHLPLHGDIANHASCAIFARPFAVRVRTANEFAVVCHRQNRRDQSRVDALCLFAVGVDRQKLVLCRLTGRFDAACLFAGLRIFRTLLGIVTFLLRLFERSGKLRDLCHIALRDVVKADAKRRAADFHIRAQTHRPDSLGHDSALVFFRERIFERLAVLLVLKTDVHAVLRKCHHAVFGELGRHHLFQRLVCTHTVFHSFFSKIVVLRLSRFFPKRRRAKLCLLKFLLQRGKRMDIRTGDRRFHVITQDRLADAIPFYEHVHVSVFVFLQNVGFCRDLHTPCAHDFLDQLRRVESPDDALRANPCVTTLLYQGNVLFILRHLADDALRRSAHVASALLPRLGVDHDVRVVAVTDLFADVSDQDRPAGKRLVILREILIVPVVAVHAVAHHIQLDRELKFVDFL